MQSSYRKHIHNYSCRRTRPARGSVLYTSRVERFWDPRLDSGLPRFPRASRGQGSTSEPEQLFQGIKQGGGALRGLSPYAICFRKNNR